MNKAPTEVPFPDENDVVAPYYPDDCLVEVGKVSQTMGGVFGLTADPGPGYIWP